MVNPIHVPAVFAEGGIKNSIQKTLQSGQDPQDATWTAGWGGITMVKAEDGGKPPKGQDFNGVLNALGAHTVFNQNGGRYQWSQDVIDNYGGYAKDAIIQSDDGVREYRSLINNNTVNPNNGIGSAWLVYAGTGSIPTATSTTAGIMPVINNLTSTAVGSALSAAQGKVLQDTKLSLSNYFALKALNGYFIHPNGMIEQWGYSAGVQLGLKTITFPSPFPNSCANIQTTVEQTNQLTNGDGGFHIYSRSNSSFQVFLQIYESSGAGDITGFYWRAIGY